ncbi:hypothetical protein [Allorhizocola rhizosphaerae]|uniref:hypothetical protein n=1 Tax=Allorhizocola rhizosphaerae TaxID=1872709 RepID=UPI0013C35972|nr:hypothetical protein [Allorhizocola rhizosphaerae]
MRLFEVAQLISKPASRMQTTLDKGMRRRVEVKTALGTRSGPPTASQGFGQAFDYDLAMGRRPSRHDLLAGRREYEVAVRKLQQAMLRFEAAGVPLTTDLGRMMQLWNRSRWARSSRFAMLGFSWWKHDVPTSASYATTPDDR